MGVGVSVFLVALGAVLTWGVNASVSGLDINVIGVILMLAGTVGLLATLTIFGRRDRAEAVHVSTGEAYPGRGRVVEREVL